MTQNRPLPYNIEAERALLGAAMQWPDRVLGEMATLGLKGFHFYRPEHQQLFGLLLQMERDGENIDLVTIPDKIARSKRKSDFGDIIELLELPDHVSSSASVGYHARTIMDDERRRSLIDAVDDVRAQAMDASADPQQLVDVAVSRLLTGNQDRAAGGWIPLGATLAEVVDEQLHAFANPDERRGGYSTGFRDLDAKLGGLFPSDLIVLAGRPAMGKSAIGMQVAENLARKVGPVGVFSLEMPRIDLARRSACARASISVSKMRQQRLNESELIRLQHAMKQQHPRLFIEDKGGLTISEIAARSRRLERQEGKLAAVLIDYLQIVGEELGGRNSREREVAHVSTQSKRLAKDLGCPVILVAQLNRTVESRKDKRPIMSDLRESGAIEQDADVIVFMFRAEYYWPKEPKYRGQAEAIIAKQRNGPTGSVDLFFEGQFTRFRDLTSEEVRRQSRPA